LLVVFEILLRDFLLELFLQTLLILRGVHWGQLVFDFVKKFHLGFRDLGLAAVYQPR
jgi:hypothetical protein